MMNAYFICHNVQVKYSFDEYLQGLIFGSYLGLYVVQRNEIQNSRGGGAETGGVY